MGKTGLGWGLWWQALIPSASFSGFNSTPHLWSRTELSFVLLLLQPLSVLPHPSVPNGGSYGAEGECTVWIPSFPQCEVWYRRGASGSCFLPGHMCTREREAVPSRCWLLSGVTSATNELPPLRSHLCPGWSALNSCALLGGHTRAQLLPWAGTTLKGPVSAP